MRQRTHVKMARIVSLSLCAVILFSFANALALVKNNSGKKQEISAWSWGEGDGLSYAAEDSRWVISAARNAGEAPLTRAELEKMLPPGNFSPGCFHGEQHVDSGRYSR